jgi:hypothetical protein
MGLQAADKQGNIAAQAPPVGVHFVQYEKAAAMVCKDGVTICGTDLQVLQHHVVCEQDVWRIPAQGLAFSL